MSNKPQKETQFWDLVDQFIQQANEACDQTDPGIVSAALLNAAARFNAFIVASSSLDRKEFIDEMDSAQKYLTNRYRDLITEHLEDYRENYKVYVRAEENPYEE